MLKLLVLQCAKDSVYLAQVGLRGLEAGLDKFEPRRGGRLSTAVYWCAHFRVPCTLIPIARQYLLSTHTSHEGVRLKFSFNLLPKSPG